MTSFVHSFITVSAPVSRQAARCRMCPMYERRVNDVQWQKNDGIHPAEWR